MNQTLVQRIAFIACVFVIAKCQPRILIDKTSTAVYPVAYVQYPLTYEIYNIGNDTAFNVTFDDRKAYPSDKFYLIKGSLNVVFPKIEAKSNVTHSAVLFPIYSGSVENNTVVVHYTDSKTNELRNTRKHEEPYYVISYRYYTRWFTSHINYFYVFFVMTVPITLLTMFAYRNSAKRYPAKKKSV